MTEEGRLLARDVGEVDVSDTGARRAQRGTSRSDGRASRRRWWIGLAAWWAALAIVGAIAVIMGIATPVSQLRLPRERSELAAGKIGGAGVFDGATGRAPDLTTLRDRREAPPASVSPERCVQQWRDGDDAIWVCRGDPELAVVSGEGAIDPISDAEYAERLHESRCARRGLPGDAACLAEAGTRQLLRLNGEAPAGSAEGQCIRLENDYGGDVTWDCWGVSPVTGKPSSEAPGYLAIVTGDGATRRVEDAEGPEQYQAAKCRSLGFANGEPEHATCVEMLAWRRSGVITSPSSGPGGAGIGALGLLFLALLPMFLRR